MQKRTPGVPHCVRWMALGIEECVYGQKKKQKVVKSLRTGEACSPCRSVHEHGFTADPALTCYTVQEAEENRSLFALVSNRERHAN
jgi:hypothetical protein